MNAKNIKFRVRREPPKVRPHASGAWTICIGKRLNGDKSKLLPKDWYFRTTEDSANADAANINKRWSHIVRNWPTLYQPTLKTLGRPFADIPHWQPALVATAPMTDAAIQQFQDRPTSRQEIGDVYSAVTVKGVVALFKIQIQADTANNEKGKTTAWTDEKNLRGALQFINEKLPMTDLTGTMIQDAKTRMLKTLARRTARNYLESFKRMLVWFYDSDYGNEHERPSQFDKAFSVGKAAKKIKTYSCGELRTLLMALQGDDEQLCYTMLALNCGMYQADIGRLTLDEINLDEGYVFWDREKQPNNSFKVRHDLWPETLKLVRKVIQAKGKKQLFFTEHRRHEPTQIDCSTLAFVNGKGEPLYRVRPSGQAMDFIGKAFMGIEAEDASGNAFQFHNLRKSTNQELKDLLSNKAEGNEQGTLIAITEISTTYLSQKSDELERLYHVRGVKGFGLMNKYLKMVGESMRKQGVFDAMPSAK